MGTLSRERLDRFFDLAKGYYSWETVLREYDVKDISDKGEQWELACPFHADKRPSFRITKGTGIYHCFSCGRAGTIIHFMHEMSGADGSLTQYCEQLLKQTPYLQETLGFRSLYLDGKTLDPSLMKRRTFDPNLHLGSEMPLSSLLKRAKDAGNTWENLVISLSLLQSGVTTDQVASTMSKRKVVQRLSADKVSLLDLLGGDTND